MFRNKVQAAWEILRCKGFILITDTKATADIPYTDPYSLKDVMALTAQQAALEGIMEKLENLTEEHAHRIESLSHKED